MKPDFYTGSMHKWPCGPKEKGLLYVNKAVHDRIHPIGRRRLRGRRRHLAHARIARPARRRVVAAVTDALKFQGSIGRADDREALAPAGAGADGRSRASSTASSCGPITDPSRSAAIVIFQPGSLDPRKLGAALTQTTRSCATARTGDHNPGLRFAPHFYNTMDEMDRASSARSARVHSPVRRVVQSDRAASRHPDRIHARRAAGGDDAGERSRRAAASRATAAKLTASRGVTPKRNRCSARGQPERRHQAGGEAGARDRHRLARPRGRRCRAPARRARSARRSPARAARRCTTARRTGRPRRSPARTPRTCRAARRRGAASPGSPTRDPPSS